MSEKKGRNDKISDKQKSRPGSSSGSKLQRSATVRIQFPQDLEVHRTSGQGNLQNLKKTAIIQPSSSPTPIIGMEREQTNRGNPKLSIIRPVTSPSPRNVNNLIDQQHELQLQNRINKITKMAATTGEYVMSLYKELKTEWSKKNTNLQKCGSILEQLKIELTKISYLPTQGAQIPKQDLILSRDVLEIAVEYSVAKKDIPAFERYISQLKCYYYDYRQIIGESENMYKLLGLNLIYLLSVNRVSDFHTELELLSTEVSQRNCYIRPILALEQYIMEGRYNKIFQARGSLTTDLYNFFMDNLVETVRDEIGACLEKSYEKISVQEAAKRLNLKRKEEVKEFGAKRNWTLGPGDIYYFVTKAAKPKEPLPSIELAEQAIFYARELEMIV